MQMYDLNQKLREKLEYYHSLKSDLLRALNGSIEIIINFDFQRLKLTENLY